MVFFFFVLSIIRASLAGAFTSADFLGHFQGQCSGKYERVMTEVSIEPDLVHPDDLKIGYGRREGRFQETISASNRTVKDSNSPYPDTYLFREVTLKQEERTGLIQTTLNQKIYSRHRSLEGKVKPLKLLKLTLSRSVELSLPDQLVIEGAQLYSLCILTRVGERLSQAHIPKM